MKVYLDNCAYNRPFDDQADLVVRLESEAKLHIQSLIREKKLELVWSFVLDYENSRNPFLDKQEQIGAWRHSAAEDCILTEQIREEAKALMQLGLKQADAAHLACAISTNADYFITTDKKVLRTKVEGIKVVNPIAFVQEHTDEN